MDLDDMRAELEARGYQVFPPGEPTDVVSVIGSVSARTHEPFVRITAGGYAGQFTVDQAREHAQAVVEAAQNAICDATLFSFGKQVLDLDDDNAAGLIEFLRKHRNDKWGSSG